MNVFFYIKPILCLSLIVWLTNSVAQSKYEQAINLSKRGNYDSAIYYFNYLIQQKKSLNNEVDIAAVLLNRGKAHQLSQKYDLALSDYYSALTQCEKSNNINGKMSAYIHLAEFNRHLGKYKDASRFIELADQLKNNSTILPLTKASFYNRKAAILAETGGTREEIISYSKNAIELANKHRFFEIEGSSLNQIGYLYSNGTIGLNYYKKALAVFEKADDVRSQVDVLINISRIYQLYGGPFDKGILYTNKGILLCEGKDWFSALRDLHHIKASCYDQMGEFKKVNMELGYVIKYTEANLHSQFEKNVKDVETKYQVKEKDLILANEKKKTELLEKDNSSKNQRLNAIVIVTLLLILFLSASIFFYFKIKKTNIKLSLSNNQKDVLIQEIHHRVKNNFQIISGLMNMQLKNISDTESRKVFEDALQRIHSMAIIHQQLHSGENLDSVKIKEFLTDILKSLAHSDMRSQDFFSIDGNNTKMHIEQAIPLGMIIHELATNSIKYAWNLNQNKKIDIHIENNNGTLMLSYNDNGKGLPTNLDIKTTTSLGLKLVDLFIHRQLQGSMIYENRNGAFFKFTVTLR